jgi:prepilin-type processing-associated H-X9-DG protein
LSNPNLVAQGGSTWAGPTQPFLQDHVLAAVIEPINRGDFAGRSRGFNSWHDGGAQFLMMDGSVRFISENVQQTAQPPYGLFQHLASISEGEIIGDF